MSFEECILRPRIASIPRNQRPRRIGLHMRHALVGHHDPCPGPLKLVSLPLQWLGTIRRDLGPNLRRIVPVNNLHEGPLAAGESARGTVARKHTLDVGRRFTLLARSVARRWPAAKGCHAKHNNEESADAQSESEPCVTRSSATDHRNVGSRASNRHQARSYVVSVRRSGEHGLPVGRGRRVHHGGHGGARRRRGMGGTRGGMDGEKVL